MTENKGESYTTISSKITLADKLKLLGIAESFGTNINALGKALIFGVLHYLDKGSDINEMNKKLFDTLCSVAKNVENCKLKNQTDFSSIVFFRKPDYKGICYKRPQAIIIRKNGDMLTECYNYDTMLQLLLSSIAPDTLIKLKQIKRDMEYFSNLHTLGTLARRK